MIQPNVEIRCINSISPNEHRKFVIYVFEVKYQGYIYFLKKRFKEIVRLHTLLSNRCGNLQVQKPRRRVFGKRKKSVIQHRKIELENYLNQICNNQKLWETHITKQFFEISTVSFISELGRKGKEGWLIKKGGGSKIWQADKTAIFKMSREYWVVLKDSFIAYYDSPLESSPRGIFLIDQTLKMQRTSKRQFFIENRSYKLEFTACSEREYYEWKEAFKCMYNGHPSLQRNPYSSFASVQSGIDVKWYVNGRDTMSSIAHAISMATKEVFIAGWQISPKLLLQRYPYEPISLCELILTKAKQGVEIFVLIYKNPRVLGLNSQKTRKILNELHPNVYAIRHPDHIFGSILFSHHEKIVVVDRALAFLGGIDLAYGRYDDHEHHLVDDEGKIWPDEDYYNPNFNSNFVSSQMIFSEKDTEELDKETINIDDEGIHTPESICESEELHTPPSSCHRNLFVCDSDPSDDENSSVSTRSTDNFSIRSLPNDNMNTDHTQSEYMSLFPNHEDENDEANSDTQPTSNLDSLQSLSSESNSTIIEDRIEMEHQQSVDEDDTSGDGVWSRVKLRDLDRKLHPRMPWHDVHMGLNGKAAEDIAWHFIQRWNYHRLTKGENHQPILYPYTHLSSSSNFTPMTIPDSVQSCLPLLNGGNCSVQILRSASRWSAGIDDERSIQNAYIDAIIQSKHFIYIENQFFVSCLIGGKTKNRICEALYKRICQAIESSSTFRVLIVLPLHPEGDYMNDKSVTAVMHFQQISISKGKYSLLYRLKNRFPKIELQDYISFFSLRHSCILSGRLVSEQVYVHDKLMIVDDQIVICGSANINDRSMEGNGDSEIACLIRDHNLVETLMNGHSWKAGQFALSLRIRLMNIHLGFVDMPVSKVPDLTDLVHSNTYHQIIRKIASQNTDLYTEILDGINWSECVTWKKAKTRFLTPVCFTEEEIRLGILNTFNSKYSIYSVDEILNIRQEQIKKMDELQGFLVWHSVSFLAQENLLPSFGTKEGLLPSKVFR